VANIKSQIKRNRQNDKRRLRNRVYRGTARIAVKSARTAIDSGAPESQAELLKAISTLDKAAEKGVIHKNNAARRKSRLMKAFGKMVPAKVEEPVKVEPVEEPTADKAAARKRTAKAAPKAEAAAEPKAEVKKAPAKKTVAKKEPAKKTSTAAKKPATAAKKPAAKKKA
jgi:small subunit ribosomal protein S20